MGPERDGRITQRVAAEDLASLDGDPPRAALAFATDAGPASLPAVLRRDRGAIHVGLHPASMPPDWPPARAVLLIDDGRYWFELRAIVRRGTLEPTTGREGDLLVWTRFTPHHEVAWDYGTLHEEPTA